MPRQTKRPLEVVDLTDDAQGSRPAKSPRYLSSSSYSDQPSSSSRALVPSAAASAPNGTQRGSANDELEPSTQDLTQRDDDPQRELYGSFGMCCFLLSMAALKTYHA